MEVTIKSKRMVSFMQRGPDHLPIVVEDHSSNIAFH